MKNRFDTIRNIVDGEKNPFLNEMNARHKLYWANQQTYKDILPLIEHIYLYCVENKHDKKNMLTHNEKFMFIDKEYLYIMSESSAHIVSDSNPKYRYAAFRFEHRHGKLPKMEYILRPKSININGLTRAKFNTIKQKNLCNAFLFDEIIICDLSYCIYNIFGS